MTRDIYDFTNPTPIPDNQIDELEDLDRAAIIIQKNYRGYRTRKIVREHLRRLLVEEMIKGGQNLNELYQMGLGPYVEQYFKENCIDIDEYTNENKTLKTDQS